MKVVINPKYAQNTHLKVFIDNISEHLKDDGILLYEERNVIKKFNIDNEVPLLSNVVVKKYRCPNIFQRIIYSFFRQSKARRAYQNAEILLQRGFSTPINIAYIEIWAGGLFKYGYYLTGFDGAHPICEQLTDPPQFNETMACDFAAFAAELHTKGILHCDLNSTNVLFHPLDNGHYSFSVIDINRMKIRKSGDFTPHECFDNLTRFTGNLNLYGYVVIKYINFRKWDPKRYIAQAMHIKELHDARWHNRKAFTGMIKKIF